MERAGRGQALYGAKEKTPERKGRSHPDNPEALEEYL